MRFILLFITACFLLIACGQESAPTPEETGSLPESAQLYTCGMHPNVVQEGAGTCPICGMDLTPKKK